MLFTGIFYHLFKPQLSLCGCFSPASLHKEKALTLKPCKHVYSTARPLIIKKKTPIFFLPSSVLVPYLRMQAGGRDETFMLICLLFMCVVRLVLSLTLCLRLCFRSLPGAKTEEPLCLPTDISKFILFCLCRGYNSNNRGVGGGDLDRVMSLCA